MISRGGEKKCSCHFRGRHDSRAHADGRTRSPTVPKTIGATNRSGLERGSRAKTRVMLAEVRRRERAPCVQHVLDVACFSEPFACVPVVFPGCYSEWFGASGRPSRAAGETVVSLRH